MRKRFDRVAPTEPRKFKRPRSETANDSAARAPDRIDSARGTATAALALAFAPRDDVESTCADIDAAVFNVYPDHEKYIQILKK